MLLLTQTSFLSLPSISHLLALSLSSNMLRSLQSSLAKFHVHKTQETKKSTAENCVYRDELKSKKSSSRSKLWERTNYGDISDQIGEPLLIQKKDEVKDMGKRRSGYGGEEKKGVNMRVKVLMTKEEAARLLSKCKDQKGTLEFKDVVNELGRIPSDRVRVVSNGSSCHGTLLGSIPEEEEYPLESKY